MYGLNCGNDAKKDRMNKYKASLLQGPDHYWRQLHYLRHKRCLEKIDASPPNANEILVSTTYAANKASDTFLRSQRLQTKIDRDNALLLSDIYKIYTRKAEYDNEEHMQQMTNRNWKKRMMRTLRIGLENCQIYNRLQEVKPQVPSREDYARWYREMRKFGLLHSRYPPFQERLLCSPVEEVAWQRSKTIPRPVVYMDIEIVGKEVGRIAFELRADLVPLTAENFRSLCTGDREKSYKCSEITGILHGIFWQGGAGAGCIYGESFPCENYKVKHDAVGTLSMVSYGDKSNSSEFRISAAPLPPMDKKQVAFGKVILGMKFLNKLAEIAGMTESGKPKAKIFVCECGETEGPEGLMDLPPRGDIKNDESKTRPPAPLTPKQSDLSSNRQ